MTEQSNHSFKKPEILFFIMALTESEQKLNAGDIAPDFSLKGTDGNIYSLSDFKGKPLFIIFICNHCPYVKAKTDVISKLQEKFKDKINILGINSNDSDYEGEGMENMKKFVEENEINFPYLLDDTQETARLYGAVCTPDPFLFDADYKLVFHGRIDDAMTPESEATENTMEDNINKVLNNEKIDDFFKPSIGCSIKWKD